MALGRRGIRSGVYDQSTLDDILERGVMGRLSSYANRLGTRSSLNARGGVPLAEFTDFDRDGRVDLVLLAHTG